MPRSTPLVLCGNVERKESLLRALSNAGWSGVSSTSNLAQAVKLVRDAFDSCIIVDAELDDIAGLKAAQILRDLCPQAKIIFTSPQNTRDLEVQVRAIDVFYYHISSSDWAELVSAVGAAIGKARPSVRSRPKVLIVDDDKDFQQAICEILHAAGYDTISAYLQREGLELARRERPDAIVLDIIMESTTDGFEFSHEVRRDPRIKHTPILGVSAINRIVGIRTPDWDHELFPVDGYLTKPVDVKQIVAELGRLIPEEGLV